MISIHQEQRDTDDKQKAVTKKEKDIKKQSIETEKLKEEAQLQLNLALPALEAA